MNIIDFVSLPGETSDLQQGCGSGYLSTASDPASTPIASASIPIASASTNKKRENDY